MRVLHITMRDDNGAGLAAIRLHEALLQKDIESDLLCYKTTKEIPARVHQFPSPGRSFAKRIEDKILFKIFERKEASVLKNRSSAMEAFTLPDGPVSVVNEPLFKQADLVHLHWISWKLNSVELFKKTKKNLVWTLHDMNPFTGGCHYSLECDRFLGECDPCPQLANTKNVHYSKRIFEQKYDVLSSLASKQLKLVSPSQWLSHLARSSRLLSGFEHHVISNGAALEKFRPVNRQTAREVLGLSKNGPVIGFVAYNVSYPRKGFSLLCQALQRLCPNTVTVCVVGRGEIPEGVQQKIVRFGTLTDEQYLNIVYSACDFFVVPSLADNQPQTVLESHLSGTPCIGFPTGGIVEMIQEGENGFIAPDCSVAELAKTIERALSEAHLFDRNKIRQQAEQKFDMLRQADQYIELYRSF